VTISRRRRREQGDRDGGQVLARSAVILAFVQVEIGLDFWYELFILSGFPIMGTAVKKTISLPAELAREAEERARSEGKTLSAVIQDALRVARARRLKRELHAIQNYWSQKAKEKGILTEDDLKRYLSR